MSMIFLGALAAASTMVSVLPVNNLELTYSKVTNSNRIGLSHKPEISGVKCSKLDRIRIVKAERFQCKKSSAGLRWVAVSVKPQKIVPSKTATSQVPKTENILSGDFSLDATCADVGTPPSYWQTSSGFPKMSERIPSAGTVNVLMLPVDFPDLVATGSPSKDMLPITKAVGDVYADLSGGSLSFAFQTLPNYLRVSRSTTSWGMGAWGSGRGDAYVEGIVRELDPQVDFSGVDVVVVMAPPNLKNDQIAYSPANPYPSNNPLVTNEKRIFSSTLVGADGWRDPMTIVHEFGHLLGWPDLYVLPYPSGEYWEGQRYVGRWDFMGYAWTRGTFGWLRYLQGWLTEPEVLCASAKGEYLVGLSPLGSISKKAELLLLRGVSGKLIGVEVRRPSANEGFVSAATQGALVYTIDALVTTGNGPLRIQGNSLFPAGYLADAALKKGQSLTVDGWQISVVETDSFGDLIKAIKL